MGPSRQGTATILRETSMTYPSGRVVNELRLQLWNEQHRYRAGALANGFDPTGTQHELQLRFALSAETSHYAGFIVGHQLDVRYAEQPVDAVANRACGGQSRKPN